jgi:hypothetical protein
MAPDAKDVGVLDVVNATGQVVPRFFRLSKIDSGTRPDF